MRVQGDQGLHVLVVAKEPVPGLVKTRLCPPLDPGQAAILAEAALADTLEAVAACGAQRRVLALDGEPGEWLPAGFTIVPQRGGGLAERLTNAWASAGGGGIQIGMDTPQVSAALLDHCLEELDSPGVGAALGAAMDGGWWAIGLHRADPAVFAGVPMSTDETHSAQRRRLGQLGHQVAELPVLRDVDRIADAYAVAGEVPGSRFGRALGALATGVVEPSISRLNYSS
ncbi:MAG: TIGR04282 family arsenosugar biosynthesis glycosyltransferase [Acidimicrobiales bacterium]